MNTNDLPADNSARTGNAGSKTFVFVLVWLGQALTMGFIQMAASGLMAWGASDNGSYDKPSYQVPAFLMLGAFVLTQLGALIGGIMMLRRGSQLRVVMAFSAGLYFLWFVVITLVMINS